MQSIHKFTTEAEAIQAIDLINISEGIPISEYAVTRTYCTAEAYEDFWYIRADDVTKKYLDTPIEIELIFNVDFL